MEKGADVVNNLFFAPRFLKSNIDILTGHALDYKYLSPFARKQAALNTVRMVSAIAAILTIADTILPGSVETDPTSSNFGMIKVGKTRFDVTGGSKTIATLAFRIQRGYIKSSTSGKKTKLDTGKWGAPESKDLVYNFFENKLSPAARLVLEWKKPTNFQGKKVTKIQKIQNAFIPLPIQQYQQLKDNPDSVSDLWTVIAEGLGINAQV